MILLQGGCILEQMCIRCYCDVGRSAASAGNADLAAVLAPPQRAVGLLLNRCTLGIYVRGVVLLSVMWLAVDADISLMLAALYLHFLHVICP